jgi:hypothetical protein
MMRRLHLLLGLNDYPLEVVDDKAAMQIARPDAASATVFFML